MPERPSITNRLEALKSAERAARSMSFNRAARIGGAALLTVSAVYSTDISLGLYVENHATIELKVYDDTAINEENNDQAIIAMDGFRSINGKYVANHIASITQKHFFDGKIYELDTGNAPTNARGIAKAINALREEEGIKKVAIVGLSEGGIKGCEAIPHIMDLGGPDVVLYEPVLTPSGEDALRSSKQQAIALAEAVEVIPNIEYSMTLTGAAHIYFKGGDIHDPASFLEVAGEAVTGIFDNSSPTLNTQFGQAFEIASADFEDCYEDIASFAGEYPMPVTLDVGTTAYDHMQDDDYSIQERKLAAARAGLQHLSMQVPGMSHADPAARSQEFDEMAADKKDDVARTLQLEIDRMEEIYDPAIVRFRAG